MVPALRSEPSRSYFSVRLCSYVAGSLLPRSAQKSPPLTAAWRPSLRARLASLAAWQGKAGFQLRKPLNPKEAYHEEIRLCPCYRTHA